MSSENLNDCLQRFRIASRELFNSAFYVPLTNGQREDAWVKQERFQAVEEVLFENLVLMPNDLPLITYGCMQPKLLLRSQTDSFLALVNRDIDSGYWDYKIKHVSSSASLAFLSFFEWDNLSYRDNLYVRAVIVDWIGQEETIGKHVLIEHHYVQFVKGT